MIDYLVRTVAVGYDRAMKNGEAHYKGRVHKSVAREVNMGDFKKALESAGYQVVSMSSSRGAIDYSLLVQ